MRVWIFSDLHLTHAESPLYQEFLEVLKIPSRGSDQVVFAGDIFDLLIGNSEFFRSKYLAFFEAVERLASLGVRVHYIEGNHDFHLQKLFPRTVRFHEESVVIEDHTQHPTKRIYIAHGDLVDQADQAYLKLRAFLRAKPAEILTHCLPGALVQAVGSFFSRPLEQKSAELPEYAKPAARAKLRQVYRTFAQEKHAQGMDYIVLGHCHDLDEVGSYYFNMGYPPVHRQYLFYEGYLMRRQFVGKESD